MAPGSGETIVPEPRAHSGLAAGQAGVQAAAGKRATHLQARPPGAEIGHQENEPGKSPCVSKTRERTLVSAARLAASGTCCVQGTERRTKNDRRISWAGPRSCFCRAAAFLDRSGAEAGSSHSKRADRFEDERAP